MRYCLSKHDASGVRLESRSILFLVTEDWYFCLHRLPIARAARDAGFRVLVAAQVSEHREVIEREGFKLIPMRWTRRSLNPLRALSEVHQICAIYRQFQPDLVHHVALKPSLYGTIAGGITGTSPIVNNLAGLGQAFSSKGMSASIIRSGLVTAFRILFSRRGICTIVENSDDRDFLAASVGIDRQAVALIRGVGVDVSSFKPVPEPRQGMPTVTLVSRMLWPKGIEELVQAARILQQRGRPVRIQLVGVPDPSSRVSIPEQQLLEWQTEGVVEWLGYRKDVADIWAHSHIAILPSYYREGIPRSLLEAAACGRAIVTTDMPGCREIVRHGRNGLLVPPRNPAAIADAIEQLVGDPDLRQRMGQVGREMVEREFAEEHVMTQTLAVYQSLLGTGTN